MVPFNFWLSLLVCCTTAYAQHGEEESEHMGPVAFMWPPDRNWSAPMDNTPPCGSSQGVANRTAFPLGISKTIVII